MKILAFDTATNQEIITITDGQTTKTVSAPSKLSHSADLLPNIDLILKNLSLTIHDIELFAVGIGPGSFTGIRLGVTTARMLAQVLNKPLVGISTLEIIAAGHKGLIVPALDAKKNRVYTALYRSNGAGEIETLIQPGDYTPEELVEQLSYNEEIIFIGDGAIKFRDAFSSVKQATFVEGLFPDGNLFCQLAKEYYLKKPDDYNDYNNILPLYARSANITEPALKQ